MTLLEQIQDCVIQSNQSLSDCLRKARILASRLQHPPFTEWVKSELDGYLSEDTLPNYRVFVTQLRGDFLIGAGYERNAVIPLSVVPAEWHDEITKVRLTDSVGRIESLIRTANEPYLRMGFPNDVLPYLTSPQMPGRYTDVWRPVPISLLDGMLDSVRNRLLDFVLEIESIAPKAGEDGWGSDPSPQQQLRQIFLTTIGAGAGNVNVGGHDVVQIYVQPRDIGSLERYLRDQGLASEDIEKLRAAIEEDSTSDPENGWGPRVGEWVGSMVRKAADGGWDVTTGGAGGLLATALARYFGLG